MKMKMNKKHFNLKKKHLEILKYSKAALDHREMSTAVIDF